MVNIHEIKLDIVRDILKPKISITQNDLKADKIIVEILQNGKPFKLTDLEPMIVCKKPSGKFTLNPMSITNGRLEFILTQQEVVESGKLELSVLLYGVDGERFSSMKFDIIVDEELVNTDLIESEIDVSPLLSELISKIDDLKKQITDIDIETITLLIENKRDKDVDITELDLSPELVEKINESNYNDTLINQRVDIVEGNLANKRDKDVAITELDLNEEVKLKLNTIVESYDDTIVKRDIVDLQEGKRDKSVAIGESDLSTTVQYKLNKVEVPYDDTELRAKVVNLEVTKRNRDVAIKETDLTAEVQIKLNRELTPYNDTEIRNIVAGKRDKSVKISNLDLEETINAKLDNIVPPYNDAVLKNRVTTVENTLLSKRDKSVKIQEVDLSETIISKLNVVTEGYDDTDVRSLISSLQANKRDKDTTVLESELSTELQDKINSIGSGEIGNDGKSAYEVAVENGFIGDVSEWLLSLKGEKGDKGLQGDRGLKGDRGEQGIQGLKGDPGIVEDENKASGIRQIKIWTGTQLEYDTLSSKKEDTLYVVR